MNKELIKKYKSEFDHYLEEGKLLFTRKAPDGTLHQWQPLDNFDFTIGDNPIIVIDDEYVEFRKSLAEGKIIQAKPYSIDSSFDYTDLVFTKEEPIETLCISDLRIKPDEPKFKVGDFLRHSDGHIFQWKSHHEYNSDTHTSWAPQPSEWCWFYNSKEELPQLGRYEENNSATGHFSIDLRCTQYGISFCEPFRGTLPSNLQEHP